MSAGNQPPVDLTCPWCGEPLPPTAAACPACGRSERLTALGGPVTSRDSFRPLAPADAGPEEDASVPDPESVARDGDQYSPGSFAYLNYIGQRDPVFASVLVVLALLVALSLPCGSLSGILIGGPALYGLYTFERWGFWLALYCLGGGVLMGAFAFLTTAGNPRAAAGEWALGLALWIVCSYAVGVIVRRRGYFLDS